jgi:hypothetical protein
MPALSGIPQRLNVLIQMILIFNPALPVLISKRY